MVTEWIIGFMDELAEVPGFACEIKKWNCERKKIEFWKKIDFWRKKIARLASNS